MADFSYVDIDLFLIDRAEAGVHSAIERLAHPFSSIIEPEVLS